MEGVVVVCSKSKEVRSASPYGTHAKRNRQGELGKQFLLKLQISRRGGNSLISAALYHAQHYIWVWKGIYVPTPSKIFVSSLISTRTALFPFCDEKEGNFFVDRLVSSSNNFCRSCGFQEEKIKNCFQLNMSLLCQKKEEVLGLLLRWPISPTLSLRL